ncbi:hypothetical protein G9A89_016742 [Geosiphon pyriformis]|nr:hypothetical protein G9A89_016742 [Geosiphon pyriformis]
MDAAGGSELFESYEQDFNLVAQAISEKIYNKIPNQTGEERKTTAHGADREIEEAEEILGQMEMEILNLPQSSRPRLQAKLRAYKSNLDKLKRELKQARTREYYDRTERDELLSGATGADFDTAAIDQRARLLTGTERLGESSRRLQDSHRIALETETIGANVLEDIRRQREQISATRNHLMEADSYINKAQRTLKGMTRRMATNRIITVLIIIVLIALILFVVWAKFLW